MAIGMARFELWTTIWASQLRPKDQAAQRAFPVGTAVDGDGGPDVVSRAPPLPGRDSRQEGPRKRWGQRIADSCCPYNTIYEMLRRWLVDRHEAS
jgi:hypothetical protein